MRIEETTVDWLLEGSNPLVRVRALLDLCGFSDGHTEVRKARRIAVRELPAARDLSWMSLKGQVLVYNLTAIAESGLSRRHVEVERAIDTLLSQPFDANCGDLMALRAMVMLGYQRDPRVLQRVKQLAACQLPDGGWLCLHRVNRMGRTPKSCIKAANHGLLLAAELSKKGATFPGTESLINYYLKRRVFYRMDRPTQLVLNQPGRRMTEAFFPNEYFHVGLPVLLEAFAELGVVNAAEMGEAWRLLDEKIDDHGRIVLEGTLPTGKAYLPRERVGKPSKWGTLYAHMAFRKSKTQNRA